MEKPKSRDDVAVFVDFENVYVSVREKFDATPNFELIMDRCEDYGRIVIARAYADWYRYPRVTSALFANGVEPMYVPTYYYDREVGRTGRPIKNSVDIHLCIDAMRTLYTQTHIDKFVLVTGDRDFIPLVNAIRQHGKEVIIIGIGGAASAHLAQSGDEFLFYEQIADLKTPQQQRQEQQVVRNQESARRERDKPERVERTETNGKVDARREREKTERPSPATPPAAPAPETEAQATERSFYDTLVDAINLARQRGFVSNLGSLKVLMRELNSNFHESKVKDANGRAFSKFKDFVKEAERQGKVQIFTNGTVTEVLLPGEDPLRVSQFAEDLASDQVERELEKELEQEQALHTLPETLELAEPEEQAQPIQQEQAAVEAEPIPEQPEPEPLGAEESVQVAATEESVQAVVPEEPAQEIIRPTFGDREWQIFRGSMSQFNEPVRFAEIFSALRGLRNQEVFGLTNNELKELVKQAINRGMLQRTGRGARAYYRLSSQYRIVQDDIRAAQLNDLEDADTLADTDNEPITEQQTLEPVAPVTESAAGQVSDEGLAPAAKRRRSRSYPALAETPEQPAEADAHPSNNAVQLADVVADEMAVQQAAEPAPAKPRRNRRKKPAATESQGETTNTTEVEQPVAAATTESNANAEAGENDDANAANGTKKRRNRRKKTPVQPEEAAAETPSSPE